MLNEKDIHDNTLGIKLQMLPPLIKNNTATSFLLPKSKTNLYCLTLIIEDNNNRLGGFIYLDTFTNISNNEYLNIYKELYDWQASPISVTPDRLFLISSIFLCKRKTIEPNTVVGNAKKDDQYQKVTSQLLNTIPENASFPFVVSMLTKILDIIKHHLGNVKNNAIATAAYYFNKHHGDLDKIGVVSINLCTQNVDFNYELIIYNNEISAEDIEEFTHPPLHCFNNSRRSNIFPI